MEKKVLVAGCGISGIQAANLLLHRGDPVILYDGNEKLNRQEVLNKLDGPAELLLGELPDEILPIIDYTVISPGIPLEVPFVKKLQAAGIEIRSEIELAFSFEKGRVAGITGTNGKTTTTALAGEIMKAWLGEDKSFTVGNIGIPYALDVEKTGADTVSVIELSSFQLESIRTFRPHVSAILNITPDHLDRHHTMENYAAVKEQIVMNAGPEDFVILNYEDERLRAFGESGLACRVVWFSGKQPLKDGYFLWENTMYYGENGEKTALLSTDEVNLLGQCNYENILAAIAVTRAMGVPMETVLQVTKGFKAVAHRIEFVEEINGVRCYDDSKGTNTDAAIQGIRAMRAKTVLIGGGYDKGSEFDDWIEEFGDKVKFLLLMGQTREKIAACAKAHGFTKYAFVDNMEEAVSKALSLAEPGENILLSPACASWGMFKNYEERGDIFKALVREKLK